MVYSYEECIRKYQTDYALQKVLKEGSLVRLERGIYADKEDEPDLAVISKRYPAAVFTMNSAFYYHGLTDAIPQAYYLLTDKDATKIRDPKIKQFFDNCNSLETGTTEMDRNGVMIRIFNRERMLVELIRSKNKLPFDYYKEIIANYRRLVYELDIQAIQEYAECLPKTKMVMSTLQMEVF